ncbi:Choline transporter-like protein ctl1 [Fusarium oxysporum f. sp. albedinis]|nr:Choline transporter-like protein ctl1 [Fusarium oxysporum f. sp. albedinis]
MAELSQDGNLNVQRSASLYSDSCASLPTQSLDDAVAESCSEIGDFTTATLGSVGNMGELRVKEKEKEDKVSRDKELKALEVKIKALEEKWLINSEEMQALKNKYDELNSKVDALERELRG